MLSGCFRPKADIELLIDKVQRLLSENTFCIFKKVGDI